MNGILEMKARKNETDEIIDSQIVQVVDASGGFYNLYSNGGKVTRNALKVINNEESKPIDRLEEWRVKRSTIQMTMQLHPLFHSLTSKHWPAVRHFFKLIIISRPDLFHLYSITVDHCLKTIFFTVHFVKRLKIFLVLCHFSLLLNISWRDIILLNCTEHPI